MFNLRRFRILRHAERLKTTRAVSSASNTILFEN
jgi:hypothetical protein